MELVSVSLIAPEPVEDPLELVNPATVFLVHAKVEPETALVGVYPKEVALQIAGGVNELLRDGVGLTVIV